MPAGGGAGAHAAEGIIAKAVKDLLRVGGRDAAHAAERDAARALERDVARTTAHDLERDAARALEERTLRADPVDVATGEVVLRQVDLDLDGSPRLLLARTHISSYRAGRWFGPCWASTVDQRLELSGAGVRLYTADGAELSYPHGAQWPERGAAYRLRQAGAGWEVTTPGGDLLRFGTAGQRNPGELPLAAIADRAGRTVELRYDGARLVELRHSGGYRVAVDTDGGLVTGLRLLGGGPDLPRVGFGYRDGLLARVLDSAGRALRFSYDGAGRLTGWQDRLGSAYTYTYADGRCVATTGPGGHLDARFAYRPGVTEVTDSLGHTTAFGFDQRGQLTRQTDPLGHTTTWERDAAGRAVAATDALGRTARYQYDGAGRLLAVTGPGGRTSADRDPDGRPVVMSDRTGATWRHGYDQAGNLAWSSDPLGATTRFEYAAATLTAVVDPAGRRTGIELDAAGRLVGRTDPLGNVTRWERDAAGRVSAVTDPLGNVTRYGWTAEGLLAWQVRPDGATTRWGYDAEGNAVSRTDPLGQVTRTEYGPFDLPVARTRPDGGRYAFSYDTQLRLRTVTDPAGRVWSYEYDAAGRLRGETDFDGRVSGYRYDAAGRLAGRTGAGGDLVEIRRDAAGRVVERVAGGERTTYEYDAAGRLTRAANADADVRFERDAVGRVLVESCNGRAVSSAYDAQGRRVRRRTPGGVGSEWEYDPDGRPSVLRAGGHEVRFGYDPAGREVARRIGPAALHLQTYDANGRLATQTVTGEPGGPGLRREFGWRADGLLAGVRAGGAGDRAYELDAAGRVVGAHGPGGSEWYRYDLAGVPDAAECPGRASGGGADGGGADGGGADGGGASGGGGGADGGGASGIWAYAGLALRAAGRTRFGYDERGRVVERTRRTLSGAELTWRFEWSAEDRLASVTTPEGGRWQYRYDPFGRRIAKEGPAGERVEFAWDGPTLAEEDRGGQVTTWDWRPGTFQVVGQRGAGRFHAVVTDPVGTPTELVAPDGSLAWRRTGTLRGESTVDGPVACPLRFPGQYADAESGLHYNTMRYYDPEVGRYHSPDPLGLAGGPDPYGYPAHPGSAIDPLGLAPYQTFFSVQGAEDVARLMEHGGEPWPSGFTHGSLRDIFGPGLYTWETRGQAEAYQALRAARGADGLQILEHTIDVEDLARLRSVDLAAIGDDAANEILDMGAAHGYDHIRRLTGNFGPEHFFSSDVFHLFQNGLSP